MKLLIYFSIIIDKALKFLFSLSLNGNILSTMENAILKKEMDFCFYGQGLMTEMSDKKGKQDTPVTIDGRQYAQMLYGGAALLSAHASEVNDLNVFPVPDGDTGTNMTMTIEGGLHQIKPEEAVSVGDASKHFAHGVLLGARGNSGVILSQIFAGIGEELSKYETVGAIELARAYQNGIKKSYSAVQNPTEGTILTVFRESTEYAAGHIDENSTVEDFFRLHIEEAKRSLARTKELLPVLAEADVVDSGGAGYLYIALGMYEALTGTLPDISFNFDNKPSDTLDISKFTRNSVLEFGYCTEFLLRLTSSKVDPDTFEVARVIAVLEELGGESIVAYKTEDIVKVHVHTFTPGDVLARVHAFGEFLTVKVENMSLGHSESEKPKAEKPKLFSVLAVASGEGLCALFEDMGVDGIINGGQTSNPSIEEFIEAFDKCNSENIIVLPNNKNVILAARQASELYDRARVHIVDSFNLMQCYGALSVLTPGITDIDALLRSLNNAAANVVGSEVTRAVRDVTIGGKEIKTGDFISITDGEITSVSKNAHEAVLELFEALDMDDYELVTLFVGNNVSEEDRAILSEVIEDEYPNIELNVYESGQEVYDYLIAVE